LVDRFRGVKLPRELATGPVEAHPECALRTTEHLRRLAHLEPVPGDQTQHLALALLKLREGDRERVAESQGLGRVGAARILCPS